MVYQPGSSGMGLLHIDDIRRCELQRDRDSVDSQIPQNTIHSVDAHSVYGLHGVQGVDALDTVQRHEVSERRKPLKRRRAPKGRSQTVDLSANGLSDKVLERVVQRQQNAMSYFKRRHSKRSKRSKRRSLAMSTSLLAMQCDDNLFDAVHEEDNEESEEKRECMEITAVQQRKGTVEETQSDLETQTDRDGKEWRWKWKKENGQWSAYSLSNSMRIESAYKNEVDSIEITKGDVVYEVRPRQLIECHFATNRMRSIQRVEKVDSVQMDSVEKCKVTPLSTEQHDDPFEALSNALEDGDHFGGDDDSKVAQCAADCNIEIESKAILHEIESLIENREGPDTEAMDEVEGSSSRCGLIETEQIAKPQPSTCALTAPALTVCAHCKGHIEKKEEMLMVNGSAVHGACFVCNECREKLVDRPYLELVEGTAGKVRLCQECVSRRFLKVSNQMVAVPNM